MSGNYKNHHCPFCGGKIFSINVTEVYQAIVNENLEVIGKGKIVTAATVKPPFVKVRTCLQCNEISYITKEMEQGTSKYHVVKKDYSSVLKSLHALHAQHKLKMHTLETMLKAVIYDKSKEEINKQLDIDRVELKQLEDAIEELGGEVIGGRQTTNSR